MNKKGATESRMPKPNEVFRDGEFAAFARIRNTYKPSINRAPKCHKLRDRRRIRARIHCELLRNEADLPRWLPAFSAPFMAVHSQPIGAFSAPRPLSAPPHASSSSRHRPDRARRVPGRPAGPRLPDHRQRPAPIPPAPGTCTALTRLGANLQQLSFASAAKMAVLC